MSDRTDPHAVVAAFAQAAADHDEAGARALCTADGWSGAGDAVGKLYQKAVGAGLSLQAADQAIVQDGRAVVGVAARKGAKALTVAWIAVEDGPDGWSIAGFSPYEGASGQFLDGKLPARLNWVGLPPSRDAAAWGETLLGWLRDGAAPGSASEAERALVPRLLPMVRPDTLGSVKTTFDLSSIGRAGVLLAFKQPTFEESRLVVLQSTDAGWVPVHVIREPHPSALLYGLPWAAARRTDPAPELAAAAAQAQQAGIEAVARVLRQAGVPVGADGTPDAAALNERAPQVATAAAREVFEQVRSTPLTLDKLPQPVAGALSEYLDEHAPGEQPRLDPDFLRAHGPAMIERVIGELGKQVASQSLQVELGAGEERRKVEISLGDLFKALTAPKKPPAEG